MNAGPYWCLLGAPLLWAGLFSQVPFWTFVKWELFLSDFHVQRWWVLAFLGRKTLGQQSCWRITWNLFGGYLWVLMKTAEEGGLTLGHVLVLLLPTHTFLFSCKNCLFWQAVTQPVKPSSPNRNCLIFLWAAHFHQQGTKGSYKDLFEHWGCQQEQGPCPQVGHGLKWGQRDIQKPKWNIIYAMTGSVMVLRRSKSVGIREGSTYLISALPICISSLDSRSTHTSFSPHSTHLTNIEYWLCDKCWSCSCARFLFPLGDQIISK